MAQVDEDVTDGDSDIYGCLRAPVRVWYYGNQLW